MAEQKEQTQNAEPSSSSTLSASREPLFGTLLFGGIALVGVAFVGVLGFWGYQGWRASQEEQALPSIATLQTAEEQKTESAPVQEEEAKPEETELTPEQLTEKAKGTEVKVLNGGAAKGSAGVVGEALKKEGYTKVTVGNTTGNYTGTTIYFAAGLDKEAGVLKNSLLKSYPKVETKAAVADNKETSAALLTVILGKE